MSEESAIQLEEQTQEEPKLQSKSSSKKQHSYTYWVNENNKSRVLPPEQRPQKIDPPKVVTQKAEDGRSDWNTAGTWEHRKISLGEIEKIFTEKLNIWIAQNCPDTKISKVSLKGECEVIFTRNKKAVTYQINGKVEFQKKLSQEKESYSQPKNEEKSSSNVQSMSDEDSQSDNTQSDRSSEKKVDKKTSTTKPKSSKTKAQTMTFEIVDLTDHGDREYKSKADDANDKKFMSQKSESLLSLLEEVLKSFK